MNNPCCLSINPPYGTLFNVLAFVSTLTELDFTMAKKIEPGVAPQVIFYLTCLLSLNLFIIETLETIRVGVFECILAHQRISKSTPSYSVRRRTDAHSILSRFKHTALE